jgi:molecular chaperone GrpE
MDEPELETDREETSESAEGHAGPPEDEREGRVDATGPDGDEIHQLREEFQDLNDKHLRLAAEFNNFRRRTEQERQESWSRAQADLLGRLLDVLDDLQRVADLDLSNATVEAIMEGVDLVERKFVRVLDDAGVDIIDPVEEDFDPERMEAIMRVPAESSDMEDRVAQVFQKGYALKGVLVRPARVSVYKDG